MTVDIGDLVTEGFERTVARNGLLFVGVYYVLSLANGVLSAGVERRLGTGIPSDPPPTPNLSPAVAVALGLVFGLLTLVVTIGAIRTFVSEETRAVPTEHFTRNLGWVLVNTVVGGVVFAVAVGIGFLFLIVPGLFLLVSLFFWNYYVIVEGENFVEGFRRSWAATRGERLALFALGVVVVVVTLVVAVLFALPTFVLPAFVGLLVEQVGAAVANVFLIATAARTYVRLTESEARETSPNRRADVTE